MNIVIIVTGSIVGVAYLTELFVAWYSGVEWEQYAFLNRATGPLAWSYWIMMGCNVVSPQLFWFKKMAYFYYRHIYFIHCCINIGMWFERFVIIVTTLCRTYLPSTWNTYTPSFIDVGIFVGTIGMFGTFFLLFSSYFPVIAQAELKTILKASGRIAKKSSSGNNSHH